MEGVFVVEIIFESGVCVCVWFHDNVWSAVKDHEHHSLACPDRKIMDAKDKI